jgi:hypothetical protein
VSRGRSGKVGPPEELTSLLALPSKLPGPWYASTASIDLSPVVVRAANADWSVDVSVSAKLSRANRGDVEFSVYLIAICNEAPRSERSRSQMRAWVRRLTKQLRGLGYYAEWKERPPDGRLYAYCQKDMASVALVAPAVRELQRVRF